MGDFRAVSRTWHTERWHTRQRVKVELYRTMVRHFYLHGRCIRIHTISSVLHASEQKRKHYNDECLEKCTRQQPHAPRPAEVVEESDAVKAARVVREEDDWVLGALAAIERSATVASYAVLIIIPVRARTRPRVHLWCGSRSGGRQRCRALARARSVLARETLSQRRAERRAPDGKLSTLPPHRHGICSTRHCLRCSPPTCHSRSRP